ncbi:MAG: XisI protein [Blastocatellia bacterium]
MEKIESKLSEYRRVIEELLTRWASIPNLEQGIRDCAVFDEKSDRYVVISEGWDRGERIHHVVADLEIMNGKVWIQADNTDIVIARELEAQGIPKSDIVLGFRPAAVRAESEYAAT